MIKGLISDFSYVLAFPKDGIWEVNQELLDYYQTLKKRDCQIYVFTNNSVAELQNIRLKLEQTITRIISSRVTNLDKTDPDSYRQLATELELKPNEIVFVDDQLVNVEAAREAGMAIVYFTGTQEAIKKLRTLVQ